MFKFVIGVIIGTLLADSIKKGAIAVYDYIKQKFGRY